MERTELIGLLAEIAEKDTVEGHDVDDHPCSVAIRELQQPEEMKCPICKEDMTPSAVEHETDEGLNKPLSKSALDDLLGLLPEHKCGLDLAHNDHRNVYETAEQWIVDNDWCEWENSEAKQRAIETDEIWTLQWYPHTPVGFLAVAAPSLEELLIWANKP